MAKAEQTTNEAHALPGMVQTPAAQAPNQMTDPKQSLLAQLHDVKSPEAIGWWPPAPGWWVVTILMLITAAALTMWVLKKLRQEHYRKEALHKIDVLKQQPPSAAQASAVMQILKRAFFTAYPQSRHHVSSLYGASWLQLLAFTCKKNLSCTELESEIEAMLYQANTQQREIHCDRLITFAIQWLKHHRPGTEKNWQEIKNTVEALQCSPDITGASHA